MYTDMQRILIYLVVSGWIQLKNPCFLIGWNHSGLLLVNWKLVASIWESLFEKGIQLGSINDDQKLENLEQSYCHN